MLKIAAFLLGAASLSPAQILGNPRGPSVSMAAPELITVPAGKPGDVRLQFRVAPGFHINSNTPKSEFLIPTVLKLTAPTDIIVGKITYPPGSEMSFAFARDEKLSVYSGDFSLRVRVRPLHNVVPSKYMFRGQLRYQACDNAQCYPPKQLPVQFEVRVAKAKRGPSRRNPRQSPHVHH